MRDVITAIGIALAVLATALLLAVAVTQPAHSAQLKNGYWPFSVETSVRDK